MQRFIGHIGQQLLGDLADKTARWIKLVTAVYPATAGMGKVEFFHGASHTDITQPPLLFELLTTIVTACRRKDPVLHTGHEHHGKLQPLGGMQSHQRDAIKTAVIGIPDP